MTKWLASQPRRRLLEQIFGGAQLFVRGSLRLVVFGVPCHRSSIRELGVVVTPLDALNLMDGRLDLPHRGQAMPPIIMVGSGQCGMGGLQQGNWAGGLGLGAGHKAKGENQSREQRREAERIYLQMSLFQNLRWLIAAGEFGGC